MNSNLLRPNFLLKALLVFSFSTGMLLAAPLSGESFTYNQPDGQTFKVNLFGDEFFAYQETEDGYLIIRDKDNGSFCYAQVTPDGASIISTGVKVGQPKPLGLKPKQRLAAGMAMMKSLPNRNSLKVNEKGQSNYKKKLVSNERGEISNVSRAQASEPQEPASEDDESIRSAPPSSPTLNNRVGLVLLASFPDRPGDVTKTVADIDNYCNAEVYTENGNAASIYSYFKIQSNGKLEYKNNVTAWFTAANPRSYYTDNTVNYASRARELIREGLAALDAKGFDFTQCDGNDDGRLDGVNIFYAGSRVNSWSEGLWPHQSSSNWAGLSDSGLTSTYYDYQITDMPSNLTIGTFCHENGHMICDFPDLYSYDGNAANLGSYSLMHSSGSSHPLHVDPYLKIHAGWADVIDIDSASHQLCAVQQDRNFFYRYRNPANAQEYFLFEVRGNDGYEGPWGGAGRTNPADGLVIYHALETGSNTSSSINTGESPNADYSNPYELMVVESNPSSSTIPWYDNPTPGSNDAYSSTGVSSISDSTLPALKFWASDGRTVASGADIHSISAQGETMTFIIGTGPVTGDPITAVTAIEFEPRVDSNENAADDIFSVYNSGGGTLNYTISDDVAWLNCSVVNGTATTEADLVTVSYTTTALDPGIYPATITITGADGAGIETITVSLTVSAQPTLNASLGSFTEHGIAGLPSPDIAFNLNNTGGGTADYTITKTQPWLSLDRLDGEVSIESDLVTISLDATNLTAGTYNDTITITSPEATNSPIMITVTFIVGSSELIVTAPAGGENWFRGNTHTITWTSSLGGTVKIELLKNEVLDSTISPSTSNDQGSFSWTIPSGQTIDNDYKISITSLEPSAISDISNANFSILPLPDLVSLPYSESFETGTGDWIQSESDDIDWTRDSSGTPSVGTGPISAQDGDFYLYTEATSNNDSLAELTSWFDLRTHTNMEMIFHYHMYGSGMGELELLASTDDINWTRLFYQTGDNGNSWNSATIDLSAYSGQLVRLAFKGTTGSSYSSDMAIDNISIAQNGYTVAYDGNTNTGGNPPTDNNSYDNGASVSVLANTGNLTKTGYSFSNWNTQADGNGTDYSTGATFNINASNVNLYAKWISNQLTYVTWSGGSFDKPFTDSDPDSNQDGDSLSNRQEFAFGLDPTLKDDAPLSQDGSSLGVPLAVASADETTMDHYFVRRKDHGISGSITYLPQFSSDLSSFTTSSATPDVVISNTVNSDYEIVKVPYPAGTPFGRVQVSTTP